MVVGPTIPTEYYTLRTPIILGMRISFIQLEVLIILEEYRVPTVLSGHQIYIILVGDISGAPDSYLHNDVSYSYGARRAQIVYIVYGLLIHVVMLVLILTAMLILLPTANHILLE